MHTVPTTSNLFDQGRYVCARLKNGRIEPRQMILVQFLIPLIICEQDLAQPILVNLDVMAMSSSGFKNCIKILLL